MSITQPVQAETGITANTTEHFARAEVTRSDSLSHADVLVAPNEWVDLFNEGVTLSVAAARCPPATEGREPCA